MTLSRDNITQFFKANLNKEQSIVTGQKSKFSTKQIKNNNKVKNKLLNINAYFFQILFKMK